MSIAQGTTHYGYPQVQLNDRPTFADFNPAFADIDSKLYSLITGASTDHASIEALQVGLGETDLLLASVKQTADGASGKADTNAENITLLQTGLGNTDREVANKLYSVAIAEPYDATSGTYSVGDIVVYQGQRYKCTTAVAVAEPFDADKWTGEDVETVLEDIKSDISDIEGDVSDINLALTNKQVSGTGATLALQLQSLKTSFDDLSIEEKFNSAITFGAAALTWNGDYNFSGTHIASTGIVHIITANISDGTCRQVNIATDGTVSTEDFAALEIGAVLNYR